MKIQHLVLDDDVHRALKAWKQKTGVTVKEIGNSALRAALSVPTKEELLVEKLVAMGKITREDYERAVAEAEKEAKAIRKKALEAAVPGRAPKTWKMGSWTIEELYRSPDRGLQVLELRPRNAKKESTPLVVHDETHAHAVVLEGKVQMEIDGRLQEFGPGEQIDVPPGTPHAVAPLTRNARLVVIATPAVEFGS